MILVMKSWKVRITAKYLNDTKENVACKIRDISKDYLIVNELWNDNKQPLDHLQMYVSTEVSERKLRALVKSCLTQGGNEAFSMDNRHSDWRGYQGYLMKYDDTVILLTSYTDTELEETKKYYFDVSTPKPKPRKELRLEQDLELIMKMAKPNMTIREIIGLVIQYYKDNRKVIHLANINQLAWSVKLYLDKEEDVFDKMLRMDDTLHRLNQEQQALKEKINK